MWRKADIDLLLHDPKVSAAVPAVAPIPKLSIAEVVAAPPAFRAPITAPIADIFLAIALALAKRSNTEESQLMLARFKRDRKRLARTGQIPEYVSLVLNRVR
jgi:hypothetical protein